MAGDQPVQGVFPPPPGVAPNFTSPSYISAGIVPASAVFLSLSTICLLLRIYTKARIIKIFGAEDYVIIAAWIFTVLSTAIPLIQQNNGNGRHMWDIPYDTFLIYSKWAAASVILYVPAAGLAKVAILIFYLRINPDRKFRWAVFAVLFITIGFMVALCFSLIFECRPIAKFWNPLLQGTCVRVSNLYLANGILNVVTDFLVLLVPIPMLVKLHVSYNQKFLIWSIFAAGSSTCILSAVRIYFVARLLDTLDTSREVPIPTTLGVVETNLTVICGSLMVLRPFIRRHLPFLTKGDSSPLRPQDRHLNYSIFGDSTKKAKPNKNGVSTAEYGSGTGTTRGLSEDYGLEDMGIGKKRNDSDVTAVDDLESAKGRGWPLTQDPSGKEERA